jgi:hypothetical protein
MLDHKQNLVKRCLEGVENEPAYIPRPNKGTEKLQPEASHLPIPMWMSRNMQNIISAEYLSTHGAQTQQQQQSKEVELSTDFKEHVSNVRGQHYMFVCYIT